MSTKSPAGKARKATRTATSSKKVKRPTPARAVSLHLGLNSVDPKQYAGWSGDLGGCEFDANDMQAIAASQGMASTLLLTQRATRKSVLAALRKSAKQLKAGDLFFLTYSGHGGQIPDVTGEEEDKKDETWCLYDGQLIDDELYLELGSFARGVRVLVLSDSCHSGTVTRAPIAEVTTKTGGGQRPKWMPSSVGQKTYAAHKAFYDRLQREAAKQAGEKKEIDPDTALAHLSVSPRLDAIASDFGPSVILISGCQDNQTSMDGDRNGAFTERLLKVWKDGAFVGDYSRFYAMIKSGMPPSQTPNLFVLGAAETFLPQRPFQVSNTLKKISVRSALEYVSKAPIARTRATRGRDVPTTVATAFETAKTQAAVVGSEIVSFVSGVTAERREAIVNASLLAQLVAKKKVSDPMRIYDWYDAYFDVLTNIGWVIQDKGFAEYKESSTNFEAHKAILAVATVVLGAAPTALAIVTSTINALHSMDESSPWITIFNRESQEARVARFQISLAEQDADGQFFVTLMAFGLEAKSNITQVLFFKVKKQEATLRHYSGRVTINTTVLDGVGDAIKTKLADEARKYVTQLPDF